MNIWHDMDPAQITPSDFWAVIEIPKASKCKYELDKQTGLLKLDRILYTSTHYPANYGFIPRTYADDNDPLDVLVLCQEALIPMTLVECKPIGVLEMRDGNALDQKIIAVPIQDPSYNSYESILQIPKHIFDELSNFFEVYKTLEGVQTEVKGISGVYDSLRIIQQSIESYEAAFGSEDHA